MIGKALTWNRIYQRLGQQHGAGIEPTIPLLLEYL